jgi:hypothetical protein
LDEWTKFDWYAKFVRRFEFSGGFHPGSVTAFEEIFESRAELGLHQPLLPNLHHITWKPKSQRSSDAECLRFFLPSGLTSVELKLDDYNGLEVMLASIQQCCPDIAKLTIDTYDYGKSFAASLGPPLLNYLRCYPNLEYLSVDESYFSVVVRDLPVLCSLTSLRLTVYDRSARADPSAYKLISSTLPIISKISGNSDNGAIHFWNSLIPLLCHTIRDIELFVERTDQYFRLNRTKETAQFRAFFALVGSDCAGLRALTLSLFVPLATPHSLLCDIIHPLLRCSQLTRLELETAGMYHDFSCSLSDRDIEEMAKAWPSLEILCLNHVMPSWNYITMVPGRPTLSLGAVDLVRSHCPKTRCLGLTMNTAWLSSNTTPLRLQFPLLQCIDFGFSTIEEPESVAKAIEVLCIAWGIEWAYDYSNETAKWLKVQSLMADRQKHC